jgi:hypothetical protein
MPRRQPIRELVTDNNLVVIGNTITYNTAADEPSVEIESIN